MTTQLSGSFSLKKCPPGVAQGALDAEPVHARHRMPVSSTFDADGEAITPGISFDDYFKMQTKQRAIAKCRRLETPTWAVNQTQLRSLIVRFMEIRAGIRKPGTGSAADRLAAAQRKLRATISRKTEVLDNLCREYVVTTDPARKRLLQIEIQNLDTVVRTVEQGPALIAGIVYLYFRVGMHSGEIGAEFGINARTVRQTIFRLHRTWKCMQEGTDGKSKVELLTEEERRAHWRAKYEGRLARKKAAITSVT